MFGDNVRVIGEYEPQYSTFATLVPIGAACDGRGAKHVDEAAPLHCARGRGAPKLSMFGKNL